MDGHRSRSHVDLWGWPWLQGVNANFKQKLLPVLHAEQAFHGGGRALPCRLCQRLNTRSLLTESRPRATLFSFTCSYNASIKSVRRANVGLTQLDWIRKQPASFTQPNPDN
eukprot:594811-Pyramimonas_sp.AAC.1